MADSLEELKQQASVIRDAMDDKENTAMRVGTMLINILEFFGTFVDLSTLQTILNGYAGLNGQGLTVWSQSRVVSLVSMGSELDNIDGGTWAPSLVNGDIVYDPARNNLRLIVASGTDELYPCRPGVIYANMHSLRLYAWSPAGMSELSADHVQRRVISDMNVTDLNDLAVGTLGYDPYYHRLVYKYAERGSLPIAIDPNAIYCDATTNRALRWDTSNTGWIAVGSNIGVVNSLDTGGFDKALSAEMGKRVAGREATDRQRIDAIVAILKKSVFTDDQSAAIAALDELANATDSISLDKSSHLFNGISGTLTLTVSTDPAGKSVTWSSSNPSVASVNDGVVTPHAEGTCVITATSGGKTASCTIQVQAFQVDSVAIDQSDITSNGEVRGTTHQLTATTSPAGGAVSWSSSNSSVATVNQNGLVTIVANGTATITATSGTKSDSISVVVSNMIVPSIALDQNSITSDGEEAGDTHTIVATTTPSGGTVEWTSSDDSVATVANGVVTIQGNGSCTITASWNGISATCSVVVTNMATPYVDFEGDTLAKQIVLASYPHSNPNEITKQEAAAVTDMKVNGATPFSGKSITNANWFRWFTGIYPDNHKLPSRLFHQCTSLKSIRVPEGITTFVGTSLDFAAQDKPTNLELIDLPSTTASIETNAIYCDSSKTALIVRASSCSLAYSGININNGPKAIYVPDDRVSYYKGASGWSGYSSKIFGISEYVPSNS